MQGHLEELDGECRESREFAGGELGLDPQCQARWEAGNAIPFQPVSPLHCRRGLPFPPQCWLVESEITLGC